MNAIFDQALKAPTRRAIAALLLGVVIALALIAIATALPRHGLTFATDGTGVTVAGPALTRQGIAGPVAVRAIAPALPGAAGMALQPLDLTEDPTMLPDYATLAAFQARQDRIAAMLRGPVRLTVATPGGVRDVIVARERRPPIPGLFWYQLVVGLAIHGLAGWLWASAPAAPANRMFALAGFGMLLAAGSAAIYSTRELAIPAQAFRLLGASNELGASLFGVAIMTVLLLYPRRLVPTWVLGAIWAGFGPWIALAVLHRIPGPEWGSNVICLIEMIAIVALVAVQARATRGDPLGRSAVRWFGLGAAIGPGAFIATEILPPVIGRTPVFDQSLAFGFFLVIVAGVFMGLRRDRLFAVDALSRVVLYYALVTVLFLGLDALVLWLVGSQRSATLLAGVILLAVMYLPLRDRVLGWLGGARTPDLIGILEEINRMGFLRDPAQRAAAWAHSLDLAFRPLGQEAWGGPAETVQLADAGAALIVPGVAGLGALRLRLARHGHSLFHENDRLLAERLVATAARAERERAAFEQGVIEERGRIARDLHDDLAAHLMGGLAHAEVAPLHDTLRRALAELRAIVSGRRSHAAPVAEALADMRAEMGDRLDLAKVRLDWPMPNLPGQLGAAQVRALEATMREAVTNTVRHSGASVLVVEAQVRGGLLVMRLADNGRGAPQAGNRTGRGLANMAHRIAAAGGTIGFPQGAAGFCVSFTLPLGNSA